MEMDQKHNSSVFHLDTSFCVGELVKLALVINMDLEFMDRIYTALILTAVIGYLTYMLYNYGKDFFGFLYAYWTKLSDKVGVII